MTIEAITVRSFGKWAVRLWLGVASQASLLAPKLTPGAGWGGEMTSSQQDASRPCRAIPTGSAPTLRARTSGFDNHAALRLIGWAEVNQMPRSRRFHERITAGAMTLGAWLEPGLLPPDR